MTRYILEKSYSHFCENGWTGQGRSREGMETEVVWAKDDGD